MAYARRLPGQGGRGARQLERVNFAARLNVAFSGRLSIQPDPAEAVPALLEPALDRELDPRLEAVRIEKGEQNLVLARLHVSRQLQGGGHLVGAGQPAGDIDIRAE